jgi:hypothetical protein
MGAWIRLGEVVTAQQIEEDLCMTPPMSTSFCLRLVDSQNIAIHRSPARATLC